MKILHTRDASPDPQVERLLRDALATSDADAHMFIRAISGVNGEVNGFWVAATEDDGTPLWSGGNASARPDASLRDAVEQLANDWAAPDSRPETMTRDEITEQHIYQECARSLRSLLSGGDAPDGASGDSQVSAPPSQVRSFAGEDGQ